MIARKLKAPSRQRGITLVVVLLLLVVVTLLGLAAMRGTVMQERMSGNAAARAFVRLQEDNLAVPRTGPLFRLWRASHPDLADRIEFANRYSPWVRGQPLRYGDRFRGADPAPAP